MRWVAAGALAVHLVAQAPSWAEGSSTSTFKCVGRTSRVTYYAPAKHRVDVHRTEAFLDRLESLFGPPPEGWHMEYYRYPSVDDLQQRSGLQEYAGLPVVGVTDLELSRIYSVREYHPHELVHAVAARLGRPPLFFAEGLAVALTADGRWAGRDLDDIARAALERGPTAIDPFVNAFTQQDATAAYAIAGSFTTFLLDEYGVEALVEFFRACGSSGAYGRAFRHAYGKTLAAVATEWQAELHDSRPSTARAWHNPASWPGALQRPQVVSTLDARASDP